MNHLLPESPNGNAFEDLCRALWAEIWEDSKIRLHARNGQPDYGVDIYCTNDNESKIVGIQCKAIHGSTIKKTVVVVREEIEKAKTFKPAIDHYIIATTRIKDGPAQRLVLEINKQHKNIGLFTVELVFWEDINSYLRKYPNVARSFYGDLFDDFKIFKDEESKFRQGENLDVIDILKSWSVWEKNTAKRLAYQILDDRPLDRIDWQALEKPWRDFWRASTWDSVLQNDIRKLERIIARVTSPPMSLILLLKNLSMVLWSADYPALIGQLRQIIYSARTQEISNSLAQMGRDAYSRKKNEGSDYFDAISNLHAIERRIKAPHLATAFLLAGGLGAGKTHFVTQLLYMDDLASNAYAVLLDPEKCRENLLDGIHSAIMQATDCHWESIDSCLKHLKPELKRESKVVIILDGLERYQLTDGDIVKELIKLMSELSRFRFLRWVITMRDTDYTKVTADRKFFADFSRIDSNTDEETNTNEALSKALRTVKTSDGWIMLDDLNEIYRTGQTIINDETKFSDDIKIPDNLIRSEATSRREHFSNPMIAWTLLELANNNKIDLSQLIDLNYIDFVEEYWKRRKQLQQTSNVTNIDIDQSVSLLAEGFINSRSTSPTLDKIAEVIKPMVKGKEIDFEAFFEMFRKEDLVDIKNDVKKPWNQIISVKFTTFWSFQIAKRCVTIYSDGFKDWMSARNNVTQLISECSLTDGMEESVNQFALMLLDQGSDREDFRVPQDILAVGSYPPNFQVSAIWFAATKASSNFSNQVMEESIYANDYTYSERDLLACLYYVGSAGRDFSNIKKGLLLLKTKYLDLSQTGLGEYFVYIIVKVLSRINTVEELINILPLLHGCEQIIVSNDNHERQAAELIAHNAVGILYELASDNNALLIRQLYQYIIKNEVNYDQSSKTNDTKSPWKRYYFREWILNKFANQLLQRNGVGSYNLLEKEDWFAKPVKGKIKSSSYTEMEREITIAFGLWSRRNGNINNCDHKDSINYNDRRRGLSFEAKEYLDLVERLSMSGDSSKKVLAFFLVYHSVAVSRNQLIVNPVFKDVLISILRDSNLEWILKNERFKSFLQNNKILE